MPSGPPTKFSATKIRLIRAAKRLLWPHPHFYYPFGILRKRGSVLNKNFELYMGGYPRSANTFARIAFLTANPKTNVLTHRHIPTFVLHLMRCGVPGLVLIRRPLDAAVSWAIYENKSIEQGLAYWNDYYETLLPVRPDLFVVRFEDVTRDFGAVMRDFNARWGTSYNPFDHTPENAARCFMVSESEVYCKRVNGKLPEMQVSRPSPVRRVIKETHMDHLNQSAFMRNELARANDLYEAFAHFRPKEERSRSARLVPDKPNEVTARIGAPV